MEDAILFLILDTLSGEHQLHGNQARIERLRNALAVGKSAGDVLDAVKEHIAEQTEQQAEADQQAEAAVAKAKVKADK